MLLSSRILTRAALCGFLLGVPAAATATEPAQPKGVEVGIGLICNSEALVQRYLTLHINSETPETAIQHVNDEAKDPNACSMAAVAFIRGKEGAAMDAPGGQMKIMEISIVAAQTAAGWQRVTGLVQYTAIFEKLDEA